MNQQIVVTLTYADPSSTYYSITGSTSMSDGNLANLSSENYPDRLEPMERYMSTAVPSPIISVEDSNIPNRVNQSIFKAQTLQWWVSSINNENIVFTPVNNKVSWSYVLNGSNIHISSEITNLLFPRERNSFTEAGGASIVTFKDNGYMTMTSTYLFNA
jgi:hypothetical protein